MNIDIDNIENFYNQLEEKWNDTDYETKLILTAYIFKKLNEHMKTGTFRYLIYYRLGFDADAYVPLLLAGGMNLSNAFCELNEIDEKPKEELHENNS